MDESSVINEWLNRSVKRSPERLAFRVGERAVSYRELEWRLGSLCHNLIKVGPGRVLASLTPSPWLVAQLFLAAARLGVAFLPLDPAMPADRRNRLLASADCRLVVSDGAVSDLPAAVEGLSAGGLLKGDEPPGEPPARFPSQNSVIQLIIPTSGTSGEPKGVMLSSSNLAAGVAASGARLGLEAGECWLDCLPLFHIGGLAILCRCIEAGATVLLHQGFDGSLVRADLERHRVTHLSLVPAMLARLLDLAGDCPPPSSLKVVLIGGGPLSTQLAERAHRAGWPLCVSYGMSETGSQCITDCGTGVGLESSVVGRPLPGFDLSLSEGDRGVIRLRGAAVMAGYVNPSLEPGEGLLDGWFETGDLGALDGAGRVRVLGRADDRLVSGGVTIHPAEVEERFQACPGVEKVVVTARPDPVWGDLLVALVVGGLDMDAVERWARDELPGSLRPREFISVDILPRNRLGKLDRKALRELVAKE